MDLLTQTPPQSMMRPGCLPLAINSAHHGDTGLTSDVSAAFSVQVPVLFDKEEVRERLKRLPGGPMQPLTVHLRQEIDRLNIIVRLATTTLQNLRLAIAGTIALSGALIESLDALFMARIPAAWLKNSWEVRAHMKGTLSSRHTSCRKIPWQLAQQCSLQHTSTVPLHHCVVVCAAFAWVPLACWQT